MSLSKSLERLFDRILSLFMALACIILCLVMLSIGLEVVLRYFFDRPQVWVIELSEYALLYITFLGAAWVLKADGHVTVDLFTALLNSRVRAICSLVSFIVCVLVSLVLVVYGARVVEGISVVNGAQVVDSTGIVDSLIVVESPSVVDGVRII